jgi:hypothetical protein
VGAVFRADVVSAVCATAGIAVSMTIADAASSSNFFMMASSPCPFARSVVGDPKVPVSGMAKLTSEKIRRQSISSGRSGGFAGIVSGGSIAELNSWSGVARSPADARGR